MPAAAATEEAAPVAPVVRAMLGSTALEPQSLEPLEFAPRPSTPVRIRLAQLTLESGRAFRPPTGACQDVLLLVRSGELRAVGTGIAAVSAPATLFAGDAVRFGPEGDGLVQNLGPGTARTIVAYVRAADTGEPRFDDRGPDEGSDCANPATTDPLARPIRSASVRSTAPLPQLGGAMQVRILLDEEGAGARYGGLAILEGEGDVTVPLHRHEQAAEVLWIEDGSGTMRVGDREIAVRAGMAIHVPAGELHDFRGDGARPLRAIQVYTPSGPEQRFRGAR